MQINSWKSCAIMEKKCIFYVEHAIQQHVLQLFIFRYLAHFDFILNSWTKKNKGDMTSGAGKCERKMVCVQFGHIWIVGWKCKFSLKKIAAMGGGMRDDTPGKMCHQQMLEKYNCWSVNTYKYPYTYTVAQETHTKIHSHTHATFEWHENNRKLSYFGCKMLHQRNHSILFQMNKWRTNVKFMRQKLS